MDEILTELKMNVGSWYLWVVRVRDDISFLSWSFKTLNLQHTEILLYLEKNKAKPDKKIKGKLENMIYIVIVKTTPNWSIYGYIYA